MARLGGTSFVVSAGNGTWQLETRRGAVMNGAPAEHVREGVPVLSHYCDALGIRAFASGTDLQADLAETSFHEMVGLVRKPVINMESAANHPCQALADWKTLDDLVVPRRARFVLSWVNHPRALPLAVPSATVHMAAMRGMDVVVLRPEGFALPAPVMQKARRCGRRIRRIGARDRRSRRGARGRTRGVRQGMGIHLALWQRRGRCAPARRNSPTGACAIPGSRRPPWTANSCTACRCGVMSRSPTKCSMAAAASCSARPTTGWWCRPRFCTACSATPQH